MKSTGEKTIKTVDTPSQVVSALVFSPTVVAI